MIYFFLFIMLAASVVEGYRLRSSRTKISYRSITTLLKRVTSSQQGTQLQYCRNDNGFILSVDRRNGRLAAMQSRWHAHKAEPDDTETVSHSLEGLSMRDFEQRAAKSWILRSFLFGASTSLACSASATDATDALCITPIVERKTSGPISNNNIIVKRLLDEREYRAVTLPNGLRVLLVSDPKAIRGAAAMDVHVGSFSDPKELPGLAHFCEHMSFLGTVKYPGEEEFSSFLSQHGGSSNAYTDNEDTVYYYDVNADFLDESLDRFAQFFVAPLFTPSATNRELNAIDSEHTKNINSDGFRIYQLEKDGANPNHPLNKFATGNKFTLETNAVAQGINNRELLLDFHNRYYRADQMTLSVLSSQKLDQLEQLVRKYFTPVKTNDPIDSEGNAPTLQWWGKEAPYIPQTSGPSLMEVVPVSQQRYVTIAWPIWIKSPEEKMKLLRSKPSFVLTHLLGHEGPGSLRSYLVKSKGWANGVQSAIGLDSSDLELFEVTVDLTEDGLKHRNEVVAAVFAYIDMLRGAKTSCGESGLPEYIYQELIDLARITFDYAEKSDAATYVTSLANNMQEFRHPADYIAGPNLFNYPDQQQVNNYLEQLNVDQARVMVVAPEFKGRTKQVGRYYGTEYNNFTSVPTNILKQWKETASATRFPELRLPAPNDLIPKDFTLVSTTTADPQVLKEPPKLVRNDSTWQVWHKVDRSFKQPKVYAIFSLDVPADEYTPLFVVNSRIFLSCFFDSQNEYLYDAQLAGLSFQLDFTSRGIQFIFSGYNDKLDTFAQRMLKAVKGYEPDMETYSRMKELVGRDFSNWATQQPYYHAAYFASLVSETLQFPINTLKQTLQKDAKIEQLLKDSQGSDFLSRLFRSKGSHGTAIIIGNILQEKANELVELVETEFPILEPLLLSQRSSRQVILYGANSSTNTPGASYRIKHPEPNKNDDNSAVSFYFQLPSRDPTEYMYVELLADVLEQPFYNSLRTQQQLGYIVYSGIKNREGIRSLAFVAQSAVVDSDELRRRIETFIDEKVPALLESLTVQDLKSYQRGIVVRKSEPDQRLTSQATRFWSEILLQQSVEQQRFEGNNNVALAKGPLFDRAEREIAAVNRITLQSFKDFAKKLLMKDSSARRLLISQISCSSPNAASPSKSKDDSEQYTDIIDEIEFRSSSTFI